MEIRIDNEELQKAEAVTTAATPGVWGWSIARIDKQPITLWAEGWSGEVDFARVGRSSVVPDSLTHIITRDIERFVAPGDAAHVAFWNPVRTAAYIERIRELEAQVEALTAREPEEAVKVTEIAPVESKPVFITAVEELIDSDLSRADKAATIARLYAPDATSWALMNEQLRWLKTEADRRSIEAWNQAIDAAISIVEEFSKGKAQDLLARLRSIRPKIEGQSDVAQAQPNMPAQAVAPQPSAAHNFARSLEQSFIEVWRRQKAEIQKLLAESRDQADAMLAQYQATKEAQDGCLAWGLHPADIRDIFLTLVGEVLDQAVTRDEKRKKIAELYRAYIPDQVAVLTLGAQVDWAHAELRSQEHELLRAWNRSNRELIHIIRRLTSDQGALYKDMSQLSDQELLGMVGDSMTALGLPGLTPDQYRETLLMFDADLADAAAQTPDAKAGLLVRIDALEKAAWEAFRQTRQPGATGSGIEYLHVIQGCIHERALLLGFATVAPTLGLAEECEDEVELAQAHLEVGPDATATIKPAAFAALSTAVERMIGNHAQPEPKVMVGVDMAGDDSVTVIYVSDGDQIWDPVALLKSYREECAKTKRLEAELIECSQSPTLAKYGISSVEDRIEIKFPIDDPSHVIKLRDKNGKLWNVSAALTQFENERLLRQMAEKEVNLQLEKVRTLEADRDAVLAYMQAFPIGYTARDNGVAADTNPYPASDDNMSVYHAWNEGWRSKDAELATAIELDKLRETLRMLQGTMRFYKDDFVYLSAPVFNTLVLGNADPQVRLGAEHLDDVAVDTAIAAAKAKLTRKRGQGRDGWNDPARCTTTDLAGMLVEHMYKGDPLDIIIFAIMLYHRNGREEIQAATSHLVSDADLKFYQNTADELRESYNQARSEVTHLSEIIRQRDNQIARQASEILKLGQAAGQASS